MKTDKNGIEKVGMICEEVLKLSESDFAETEKMILGQKNYSHPLKMATAAKQHALGDHNQKVLDALRNLRNAIKEGSAI